MTGFPCGAIGLAACLATSALLPGAASAESRGKPANLCQELAAFVHPPAPAAQPGQGAAQPGQGAAQPGQAGGQAAAVQAPGSNTQNGNAPPPKPADVGDTTKNSGLSGPVAQSGPGAAGPQGQTQNGAAPSGAAAAPKDAAAAAPTPPAPPPPKKPSPESVVEADAAAGANDIAGCQRVARQMRRTGVVMPAPLMALAALDLRLLEAAR